MINIIIAFLLGVITCAVCWLVQRKFNATHERMNDIDRNMNMTETNMLRNIESNVTSINQEMQELERRISDNIDYLNQRMNETERSINQRIDEVERQNN